MAWVSICYGWDVMILVKFLSVLDHRSSPSHNDSVRNPIKRFSINWYCLKRSPAIRYSTRSRLLTNLNYETLTKMWSQQRKFDTIYAYTGIVKGLRILMIPEETIIFSTNSFTEHYNINKVLVHLIHFRTNRRVYCVK